MMNHPQRDTDGFSGAMIILVIAVILTTITILGFDGVAAVFSVVWDMIKSVHVKIWNWIF
jgi:hypothetical protein